MKGRIQRGVEGCLGADGCGRVRKGVEKSVWKGAEGMCGGVWRVGCG